MALDKIKQNLGAAAGNVAEAAKIAGGAVAEKAKAAGSTASEKAHEGIQQVKVANEARKLDKLAPVFPDEFFADDYDLPYMIIIVDEDVRKGIDQCEGAIGWLTRDRGMEVLHLYREFVDQSKLNFHPRPMCDSVYYVDTYDPHRYIDVSCLFEVLHQDKITELRDIARCLGAKSCQLVGREMTSEKKVAKRGLTAKLSAKGAPVTSVAASGEATASEESVSNSQIIFMQRFEGDAEPVRPTLNWFKNDREIQSLVEMRCGNDGANVLKDYAIEIDNSQSASMSNQRAQKIDAVLKGLKISVGSKMEEQLRRESQRRLKFIIEF